MKSQPPRLAALQLLGCAALACLPRRWVPMASSPSARDTEDSNALIMTAEIALQRDDCGRAAANYAVAAQRLADAKLAERAAGVALDCGQYQAAERAAARWRAADAAQQSGARCAPRCGRTWVCTRSTMPARLRGLDQDRRRHRRIALRRRETQRRCGAASARDRTSPTSWHRWRRRPACRRRWRCCAACSRRRMQSGAAAAGARRAGAGRLELSRGAAVRRAGTERRRRSCAHAAGAGACACRPGRGRSGGGGGRALRAARHPRSRASLRPTC